MKALIVFWIKVSDGVWLDFGHLNTFFRSRSLMTTQRVFNDLKIEPRKVIKASQDKTKMLAESNWFKSLPLELVMHIPALLADYAEDGYKASYALEYLYLLPLSDLLVFGRLSDTYWHHIFSAAYGITSQFACYQPEQFNLAKANDIYLPKTLERIQKLKSSDFFKQIAPIGFNDAEKISSMAIYSAKYISPVAAEHVGIVHGDYYFSNILFDSRTQALKLPEQTKRQVIDALKSSRAIKPHFNKWLLFSAMIEAFFFMVGEDYDKIRIDYALRQHEQWYLGDGHYSDGPHFRADYYNSYVILPFLLQLTDTMKGQIKDWDNIGVRVLQRAQRYAEIQERMISPDATFPPIVRSIAYRGAAFHLLAQLALMKKLPASLKSAQVRCALWAVIEKTLLAPSNYDENGWLNIGLNGHQPGLGENYISTGSLYLTSVIFLPLGLPDDDEFWTATDELWSQRKIWWFGYDVTADKAF